MPLDLTEYASLAQDEQGRVIPAGLEPALAVQQLTPAGVAVASAAFSSATRFVRLHTDVNCRIEFRSNGMSVDPVAAATSMRLPAGATEFFGVRPGHKLSVISSS